jgi:hypothetical protein
LAFSQLAQPAAHSLPAVSRRSSTSPDLAYFPSLPFSPGLAQPRRRTFPYLTRETAGLYPSNPPLPGFDSPLILLAPRVYRPINSRPLLRTASPKPSRSCRLEP